MCDVTLLVVDEDGEGVTVGMGKQPARLKAHRLVLAACSHYFKAMFTSEMAEAGKGEDWKRAEDGPARAELGPTRPNKGKTGPSKGRTRPNKTQ